MHLFTSAGRRALPVLLGALVFLFLHGSPAFAQTTDAEPESSNYGTGAGLQILLTNSGFGLGGYYQHTVSSSTSFLLEANLRSGKHESEATFTSWTTGRRTIFEKANYLLMMPVHLGLQRRLFQDRIEDNFRPYVQVAAGPTLGWEYPYFDDCNGDGQLNRGPVDCNGDGSAEEREDTYDSISGLPKGELRFGVGGIVALGAHFGRSTKTMQGVRIGYTFHYFPQEIHLLEEVSQHFFGSPSITLIFGRLF